MHNKQAVSQDNFKIDLNYRINILEQPNKQQPVTQTNYKKAIISLSRLVHPGAVTLAQGLEDLGIDVKWVAFLPRKQNNPDQYFPHAKKAPWASHIFTKYWNVKFDKKTYDEVLTPRKNEALPIVERYSGFYDGSLEAEIRLAQDFSVAQYMIEDAEPDLVIFNSYPESALEFCLYHIANYHGIKTIFTRQGGFPHSRTIGTDMYAPILNTSWNPDNNIIPVCNLQNPNHEHFGLTIENIYRIKEEKNYLPGYMQSLGVSSDNSDKIKMGNKKNLPSYNKEVLNYVESIATPINKVDTSKKIYYFPLHYQPEVTSMPAGYEYANQLKVIKLVSDRLSSNELLLIKEHPSTFLARTHPKYRTKLFYEFILKIPNTVVVSTFINSTYLIDLCYALITLTGQAGIEAIVRNKPVIVFGNAAYINAPGVIKSEEFLHRDLNLDDLKIRFEEVSRFFKYLDGCSMHLDGAFDQHENPNCTRHNFCVYSLLQGLRCL